MPAMPAVLIIEDDPAIRQGLARFLADAGHSVESLSAGMEGVQRAAEGDLDVVVLDLGLPDIDGAQVLKMIRAVSAVPIVVATARDEEAEIVRILREGADDYVVKPFSGAQLQARIEAIIRRTGRSGQQGPLVVGDLTVDVGQRVATLSGEPVELTRKEFDLLAYLAERTGVVVSKRELLAEVWRQPYGGADKTVDVHLSVLRRKLGESAAEARYLQTVHGVGIKLVAPDS
jgi:DNA-binding response OmpR family regulator